MSTDPKVNNKQNLIISILSSMKETYKLDDDIHTKNSYKLNHQFISDVVHMYLENNKQQFDTTATDENEIDDPNDVTISLSYDTSKNKLRLGVLAAKSDSILKICQDQFQIKINNEYNFYLTFSSEQDKIAFEKGKSFSAFATKEDVDDYLSTTSSITNEINLDYVKRLVKLTLPQLKLKLLDNIKQSIGKYIENGSDSPKIKLNYNYENKELYLVFAPYSQDYSIEI